MAKMALLGPSEKTKKRKILLRFNLCNFLDSFINGLNSTNPVFYNSCAYLQNSPGNAWKGHFISSLVSAVICYFQCARQCVGPHAHLSNKKKKISLILWKHMCTKESLPCKNYAKKVCIRPTQEGSY